MSFLRFFSSYPSVLLVSNLLISGLLVTGSLGCSLYQSTGREAIEKGTIPISSGLDASLNVLYECHKDYRTPHYLKAPFEVLEAPLIPREYSVLLQGAVEPFWVVIYTHVNHEKYYSCQYHITQEHFDSLDSITVKGFQKIEGLARR